MSKTISDSELCAYRQNLQHAVSILHFAIFQSRIQYIECSEKYPIFIEGIVCIKTRNKSPINMGPEIVIFWEMSEFLPTLSSTMSIALTIPNS